MLKGKLKKILAGRGVMQDIMDMERWSLMMKANRCGLGHTAANPITSTLRNLRHLYLAKIQKEKEFDMGFDLESAREEALLEHNKKQTIRSWKERC